MEIADRLTNAMRLFADDKAHRMLRWAFVWSIVLHLVILFLPVRRVLSVADGLTAAHSASINVRFVPAVGVVSELRVELEREEPSNDESALPPPLSESKPNHADAPSTDSRSEGAVDGMVVDYLSPTQLTQLPEIHDVGNLEHPGVIRPGDQGRLELELFISETGRLDRIRVVETTVPGPFLANALRVFNWARYEPGRDGVGHAVSAKIRLEIVLEVLSTGVSVVRGAPESQQDATTRELSKP